MSGFTVDYSESNVLLPEGNYECIIRDASLAVTRGGTEHISVPMIVRNDVDQGYKNTYIWHAMYRKKDPDEGDRAIGGWSVKQVQSLSRAAGLPNGKEYAGIEDWMEDLAGKPVLVTIYHDDYNGRRNARVRYCNPSKVLPCHHQLQAGNEVGSKRASDTPRDMTPVTDDDLPF